MIEGRRIRLAARPEGLPQPSHFSVDRFSLGDPAAGQFIVRISALSLDPYMRVRMRAEPSYTDAMALGEIMPGAGVGTVIASSHRDFPVGAAVQGWFGWTDLAESDGTGVTLLDPAEAPIESALGILGLTGFTAWYSLLELGRPQPGETVLVSAAAGAVGSIVGQIAKLRGARAVGIAGGQEKCRFVTDTLGFDACVDYKAPDFATALTAACPQGVDIYYENVGGAVRDAALERMTVGGRVVVSGMISMYGDTGPAPGPDRLPDLMRLILFKRLSIQGFIIMDHWDRFPAFKAEMLGWLRDGRIIANDDIVQGFDAIIPAFQGLLRGRNIGKLIVRF